MNRLIFLSFALLIFSCEQNKTDKFSLSGVTSELPDGTKLILETISKREGIDTTIVMDGKFEFKADLKTSPVQAVMHTEGYTSYRMIWLENAAMTFDDTNTNFKNAIVKGSTTEELSQELFLGFDTLSRKDQQKRELQFVNEHPESIVSANILAIYTTTWGKQRVKELFKNFSEQNKATDYGKKIARYIALNQEPEVGERFVDFTMEDKDGNDRSLSEFQGKLVLLEFWASWCGPCRQENPKLVETYKKYKPHGFEVFAVSLDQEREHWLDAIEADKLIWPQVSELNGSDNAASLIYGINGIPDNFLINQEGVIVGRNLRGDKLDHRLATLIDPINN